MADGMEELGMGGLSGGQSSGQSRKGNKAGETYDEKGEVEMWVSSWMVDRRLTEGVRKTRLKERKLDTADFHYCDDSAGLSISPVLVL
jgi:hypothetical protein